MKYLKIRYLVCLSSLIFSAQMQAQYYGVSPSVVGEWAVGLQLGSNYMRGDVSQVLPGYEIGVYAQNSFSRTIDLKILIGGGLAQGLGTTASNSFLNNSALNGEQDSVYFYDSTQMVFHNYQMQHFSVSGALKFNLNRLISPNSGDSWDLFLMAGLNFMLYETRINAYNESTFETYDYSQITASDPLEVRNQLNEILDGTYETLAQQDRLNNTQLGNRTFRSSFLGGLGFRIRATEHVAIGLEGRYNFLLDDLVDGQQWEEGNTASLSNDHLITAGLTLDYIF
ncbi:MAG: hypothetical protein AAF927_19640 [Bacteroidota bacterium]